MEINCPPTEPLKTEFKFCFVIYNSEMSSVKINESPNHFMVLDAIGRGGLPWKDKGRADHQPHRPSGAPRQKAGTREAVAASPAVVQ